MRVASLEHGSYVSIPEEEAEQTYIENWCISSHILYHRHPDEIEEDICGEVGVVEHDVNDRECWKCQALCPDAVWFIHRLWLL